MSQSETTDLSLVDACWRAANHLSAGQIYLLDNPLLDRPLSPEHIKPRLLGHWGTTPGQNFVYAHLNRVINARSQEVLFATGPGHGGPALLANTWLEGSYSEAFLGPPGSDLWLIPEVRNPDVVWAGWNSESPNPAEVTGDLGPRVSEVDGRGRVGISLTGLAPTVLVDPGDGLPDVIGVPLGTHAHANWAFGGEGTYRITAEVTATLAAGRAVADRDVFTIAVGDVDPTAGGACAPPGATTTTATATDPPPTTAPGASAPKPTGLASTGVGSLGTVVSLAALPTVAGAAALVLARRGRSRG